MDRRKLQKIGSPLGIDNKDLRSIKRKRMLEKWSIPIISAFTAILGPIIGLIVGLNSEATKEYEISTRHQGYPYSIGFSHGLRLLSGFSFMPLAIGSAAKGDLPTDSPSSRSPQSTSSSQSPTSLSSSSSLLPPSSSSPLSSSSSSSSPLPSLSSSSNSTSSPSTDSSSSAPSSLASTSPPSPWKKRFVQVSFLLLGLVIAYFGFRYTLELARPHETIKIQVIIQDSYSQAIDYGVFSSDGGD